MTEWKLAPVEPTPEMLKAAKGALYRRVAAMSQAERDKLKGTPSGLRIGWREKYRLRYQAMLEAAPESPTLTAGK